MAGNVVQFLKLPFLASSGLAVVASSMLYFKQKYSSLVPFVQPIVGTYCDS